ncbi:MAG: YabP/YqfC family sporulation protein [Clostridia bacterium]|nr:YabP/YqfC family sporulation protein [Clostridia bacterium]
MAKKFTFKSEKPKEKWQLFHGLEDTVEKGVLSGPHFELFGNREMVLEGCTGVVEYSDTYLKLKIPRGCVILCGNGFDIVLFEETVIRVKGEITSVEFCM